MRIVGRNIIGAVSAENSMEVSKKLRIELAYDLQLTLLGIYPKTEKRISKRHLHLHVHGLIIHNRQNMET